MVEATRQHLLDCVALVHDDLLKRPDFVLEVMKANDPMDLIRFRSEELERRRIRRKIRARRRRSIQLPELRRNICTWSYESRILSR
ncbi:hypothetical protein AVEN_261209-1 [Araneus ventricosus]|uniref:Uncharacterized protein n=1 Tax=Araneus ventricosus TaxID=182803 RepID=A0A4Y2RHV2_ARAVE|nr:hypothetical protein AVEN_261209-1 [Araneus ventricosus]